MNSKKNWLIVGIAGATCSGKSTLAEALHEKLKNSVLIQQDNYFLPEDDPRQVKLPELDHFNWEVIESIDMEKMYGDIAKALDSPAASVSNETSNRRVLILEGFIIFGCQEIIDMCDLKFFMTLPKEECRERRNKRTYSPPDIPGYFDACIWPEYVKHEASIKKNKELCKEITFIDGTSNREEIFNMVYAKIQKILS